MSWQSLEYAGIKIATKFIDLARQVMDDDAVGVNIKVGKNTLKDSSLQRDLESHIKAADDLVLELLFNNYVVFLEWDRPPNTASNRR